MDFVLYRAWVHNGSLGPTISLVLHAVHSVKNGSLEPRFSAIAEIYYGKTYETNGWQFKV